MTRRLAGRERNHASIAAVIPTGVPRRETSPIPHPNPSRYTAVESGPRRISAKG